MKSEAEYGIFVSRWQWCPDPDPDGRGQISHHRKMETQILHDLWKFGRYKLRSGGEEGIWLCFQKLQRKHHVQIQIQMSKVKCLTILLWALKLSTIPESLVEIGGELKEKIGFLCQKVYDVQIQIQIAKIWFLTIDVWASVSFIICESLVEIERKVREKKRFLYPATGGIRGKKKKLKVVKQYGYRPIGREP